MREIKKLNAHHKQFVKKHMSGKSGKLSYSETYPNASEKTAEVNSSQLLSMTKIRNECLKVMQETTGLRVQDFLTDLKALKQAEYPMLVNKTIKMYANDAVRLEAIKTGLKLLGVYSSNQPTTQDNRQLTINISGGDINRLSSIINEMKGLRQQESIIDGEVV